MSPLTSSRILGTYQPGEFIFQCPIFLPFHTVHGVLKVIILKWFGIPFSSEPRFVRTLHHDLSVLGGPTQQWLFFQTSSSLPNNWYLLNLNLVPNIFFLCAKNLILAVERYAQKTILGVSEQNWTEMSQVRYAEYKKEK